MISVTRYSSALAFLFLTVTLVGLHVRLCLFPFAVELQGGGPDGWLQMAAAIGIYLIAAAIVGRSGNKMRIFQGYCAFPIFLFGLYSVGVFVPSASLSASVVALLVSVGQAYMLNAIMEDLDLNHLFCSSLAFGAASCLNPVCAIYLPALVIVGLMVSAGLRRFVVLLAGFLLPFATVSYVMWYGGHGLSDFFHTLAGRLSFTLPDFSRGVPVMATAVMVTLVGLEVASVIYFVSAKSHFLRERQAFASVCITSFMLLAYDVFSGFSIELFPVLAVSGSLLVAYGLDQMKQNQGFVVYRILFLLCAIHLFVM